MGDMILFYFVFVIEIKSLFVKAQDISAWNWPSKSSFKPSKRHFNEDLTDLKLPKHGFLHVRIFLPERQIGMHCMA
jgi:hypothetical protein